MRQLRAERMAEASGSGTLRGAEEAPRDILTRVDPAVLEAALVRIDEVRARRTANPDVRNQYLEMFVKHAGAFLGTDQEAEDERDDRRAA